MCWLGWTPILLPLSPHSLPSLSVTLSESISLYSPVFLIWSVSSEALRPLLQQPLTSVPGSLRLSGKKNHAGLSDYISVWLPLCARALLCATPLVHLAVGVYRPGPSCVFWPERGHRCCRAIRCPLFVLNGNGNKIGLILILLWVTLPLSVAMGGKNQS